MSDTNPSQAADPSEKKADYLVVARRYRPQQFEDLIGQESIARALSGAIRSNRVGHAYLFTGARGVGKTSAARIFAKALNCRQGPTPSPCGVCEICESISSGDDIDVLEIDGASNRGIDEIRQLRQNANVRPSRSRLKIYIIDEVHMLTREAFNALLKTLEEPPEHVKFIFCTTDPNRLPITILSRCQRFDFAGIDTVAIARRLASIAETEGVEAEPEAIELLARRAAGSMRDGQSLLEQLLSFASERITVDEVHQMLGTAGDQLMGCLLGHVRSRDAAAALVDFDRAVGEGVDPGLFLEQLFGYLRDAMVAAVGGGPEMFLYAPPAAAAEVAEIGRALGVQTTIAAMQILDQTLGRLKQSTQGRLLAELALVRLCSLENLDALADLIAGLQEGEVHGLATGNPAPRGAVSSPIKKKVESAPVKSDTAAGEVLAAQERTVESVKSTQSPSPVQSTAPRESAGPSHGPISPSGPTLTAENVRKCWDQTVRALPGLLAESAKLVRSVELIGANRLAVTFAAEYTFAKSMCERSDQTAVIQRVWVEQFGGPVSIEFRLAKSTGTSAEGAKPVRPRNVLPQQQLAEVAEYPLVQRAKDLFGAEPTRVIMPPEDRAGDK